METYDPQKAARVWQRVQGNARPPLQPDNSDLLSLIEEEWKDAGVYLYLSRQYQGNHSNALRKMHEQEQSHVACLKGIYTLRTGSRPTVHTPQPQLPREAPEVLLRRCYGREMRSLAQYEARSSDPEYGQVFARMAEQEREHCRKISEFLGSTRRG